jgi:ribose transport system substrate-binding protein
MYESYFGLIRRTSMKKFKVFALIMALMMVVGLMAACGGGKTADAPAPAAEAPAAEAPASEPAASSGGGDGNPRGPGEYNYRLGLVQPGPEFYYQSFADSIQTAAEYAGMDVTALLSEYSNEKEVANIEDLISQGVDAITVFSLASETAQINAQLCEEAGIPLFLTNSSLGEGPADVVTEVGNSFWDMGAECGQWVQDNLNLLPDEIKVLEIQGQLGQGIAEGISQGFADLTEPLGDKYTLVHKQTANWIRSEAIAITEDSLMANMDFNTIFVHNEDMCAGVVSVLKENNVLNSGVVVLTQNGSDPGIEMIRAGEVLSSCANPPSFVGGDVVVQILRYFDGAYVPREYFSPVFMIDATNVNDPNLVTWDKKWAIQRVDAYFGGTYE